jgi:DNA mismatch repair protein MutL
MLERVPWLKEPYDQEGMELREFRQPYPQGGESIPSPFLGAESFRVKSGMKESELSSEFSFLGQIQQTYLIFSSPEGLILVDQHAAHERILLEKILDQFSRGWVPKQPFLLPEVMDLPAGEAKVLEENLSDLLRLGFELDPSGGKSFWVKSTPEILAGREPMETLKEMIKEIASWGKGADLKRSFDPLLKMMACRGAIQAHRSMGREEAQTLLAELKECRYPSHCPHGRPTLIRITLPELEKMFGRR